MIGTKKEQAEKNSRKKVRAHGDVEMLGIDLRSRWAEREAPAASSISISVHRPGVITDIAG